MTRYTLHHGDCLDILRSLPECSVHCCVTSPPYYGLRDYNNAAQIGLEQTPDAYVARLVAVFREVRRVLRLDGTLWLNLGDSYGATGGDTHSGFNERWSGTGGAGSKQDAMLSGLGGRTQHNTGLRPKNLLGIPWRVAFALQADGWYLRQDIIWHKPNPMPESVRDRCTKAHEYLFLLSKQARYWYDADAVREGCSAVGRVPGGNKKVDTWRNDANRDMTIPVAEHRNRRSVWTVATQPYAGAHFAVMPPKLVTPCVLAGCPEGGTVLDPFVGSGTVVAVAVQHGRNGVGIDLNAEYLALARERIDAATLPLFSEVNDGV